MSEPYDPYRPGPGSPYGGRPGGPLPGGPHPTGGPHPGWGYGGHPGQDPWRQAYQGQPQDRGQPGYGQPPHGQRPYGQPPYGPPSHGAPGPGDQPFGAAQRRDPYPPQPYQGSYGRPAGWDLAGSPQPPPRRPRTPLVVLGVISVLLMIGGGVAAAVALKGGGEPAPGGPTGQPGAGDPSDPAGANRSGGDFAAGQCATLTPADGGRATISAAECGGLVSDVVIAKITDAECPEPYLSFNPHPGTFYWLAMDAREGDCFRFDELVKRAVACAGDKTRKVIKIFDGVADGNRCPPSPETLAAYAYPDPPITVCLGKPDL